MGHLFSIAVCLSVCFVASLYDLRYIELSGSAIAGSGFLVTAVSNLINSFHLSENLNLQQAMFALLYYFLYVGLLTTQFYNHLVIRAFWYFASTTLIGIARV